MSLRTLGNLGLLSHVVPSVPQVSPRHTCPPRKNKRPPYRPLGDSEAATILVTDSLFLRYPT